MPVGGENLNLGSHEVMRRVNWVRVLVPVIMIMLAIWKTESFNAFGAKERKYVKEERWDWRVGAKVELSNGLERY